MHRSGSLQFGLAGRHCMEFCFPSSQTILKWQDDQTPWKFMDFMIEVPQTDKSQPSCFNQWFQTQPCPTWCESQWGTISLGRNSQLNWYHSCPAKEPGLPPKWTFDEENHGLARSTIKFREFSPTCSDKLLFSATSSQWSDVHIFSRSNKWSSMQVIWS